VRLAAALLAVAVCYLVPLAVRPMEAFWSPDSGGKLLQVLALVEGRSDLSVPYPGRAIDPNLLFHPLLNAQVVDGQLAFHWSVLFAYLSAPPYAWLGLPGLYVLPLLGGLLATAASGSLAERILPGRGWAAVLLVGLASPLWVYSTQFWEHAPAAGCATLGVLLALDALHGAGRRHWVAAGLCFGLALALRPEVASLVVALGLAVLVEARSRSTLPGLLLLGLGVGLVAVPIALGSWLSSLAALGRYTSLNRNMLPGLERLRENLELSGLGVPADLLAGAPGFGYEPPETWRWGIVLGVVLCVLAGRRPSGRLTSLYFTGGLLLICLFSLATLALPEAPEALHGLVVVAPTVATGLYGWAAGTRQPGPERLLWCCLALYLAIHVVAALVASRGGLAGAKLEWGPRFLLPAYPLLAALTLAGLARARRDWPSSRVTLGLAAIAIVLSVALEVRGLVQVHLTHERATTWGRALAARSDLPVVTSLRFLAMNTAPLTDDQPLFCVEGGPGLRRWLDLALAAGHERFWFADAGPIPAAWLLPVPSALVVEEASDTAADLRLTRYRIRAPEPVGQPVPDPPLDRLCRRV
jgi:hypothetical protein